MSAFNVTAPEGVKVYVRCLAGGGSQPLDAGGTAANFMPNSPIIPGGSGGPEGGRTMTDLDTVDFFSDPELVHDPYPYYDNLRSKAPVLPIGHDGDVIAVTGYDEANEIFRDHEAFSSCNTTSGPFLPIPRPVVDDDLSEVIATARHLFPGSEDMVTMDPPEHTRERSLLLRVMTPKRLKENEEFMRRQAHQQLDRLVDQGRCEFIASYARPFSMLAIADVLGVPEEQHETFREGFGLREAQAGQMQLGGGEGVSQSPGAAVWLDDWFAEYLEDRRRQPRSDVLTDLALAKYPDGSTPDIHALVRIATFLFAAGQETTARLLAVGMKYLAQDPELQDELRTHPERIRNFIEEALRIESPVKGNPRLARHRATVGGVDVPPGATMMLMLGAANRDPQRFESPADFQADRANAKEHIAFGRGIHSCPGGPLARAEGQITIECVLSRLRNIRLSEEHHGPDVARPFEYEPTWVLHGLRSLHIEFESQP